MILAALVSLYSHVPLPPLKYDKPYTGKLIVKRVNPNEMFAECGIALACAYPMGKTCRIVLPTDGPWISKYEASRLRRHEIGHCNGWDADHRGGRI